MGAAPCGFIRVRILTFSPAMKVVRHPLKRFYGRHDLHFVTFSCFRRRPYLGTVRARNRFVSVLKEVRARNAFALIGYVVMPEHVHLLPSVPFDPRSPSIVPFDRGCRPYGRGISSCLQMARTVPSLISRWRGTLAILCKVGLNQILWAPPSRYKTQPWCRGWRSNSASLMLPLFRKPRAPRVGKGLFPQARAGTAAPA